MKFLRDGTCNFKLALCFSTGMVLLTFIANNPISRNNGTNNIMNGDRQLVNFFIISNLMEQINT